MSNDRQPQNRVVPILRLRPVVPTELIQPRQRIKQPDGPWIAHPGLILETANEPGPALNHPPDITMDNYRDLYKGRGLGLLDKDAKREDFEIQSIITIAPPVDMQQTEGMTDREIASKVEQYYVGAHQYDFLSQYFSFSVRLCEANFANF